jgi:hypothetical protein
MAFSRYRPRASADPKTTATHSPTLRFAIVALIAPLKQLPVAVYRPTHSTGKWSCRTRSRRLPHVATADGEHSAARHHHTEEQNLAAHEVHDDQSRHQ